MKKMIPLYIEDGVAKVWNSNDWYELRSKHRICGSLIGTIASFPRQNDFMGLPMALMSEEAALLVEKGICELYELPDLSKKPTDETKQETKEIEERVLIEQKEAMKKRKIEQLSQKIDIIMAGKKQKLLSKGMTDVHIDKQVILQEEINKLKPLSPAHVLVHMPTEHIINIEKVKVSPHILNPSVYEGDGAIKFAIFKDLWEQGNYITSGSKFGSDYLLYPGDPVKFHGTYMVLCICDRTSFFSPAKLVAFGRLSVAVNKLTLLASINNGQLQYQTMQWHDSVNL